MLTNELTTLHLAIFAHSVMLTSKIYIMSWVDILSIHSEWCDALLTLFGTGSFYRAIRAAILARSRES